VVAYDNKRSESPIPAYKHRINAIDALEEFSDLLDIDLSSVVAAANAHPEGMNLFHNVCRQELKGRQCTIPNCTKVHNNGNNINLLHEAAIKDLLESAQSPYLLPSYRGPLKTILPSPRQRSSPAVGAQNLQSNVKASARNTPYLTRPTSSTV
jgi:hypothetical protein